MHNYVWDKMLQISQISKKTIFKRYVVDRYINRNKYMNKYIYLPL